MSTRELHFRVLGALRVEVDRAPATLPRSPVLRHLLGVLLLAGERPVTVERLVDLVWAGHPGQIGRGRVQTGISRLREWLSRHGPMAVAVTFDGGGYRLEVPPDAIDLGRFRMLVDLATSASDADRLELLSSAFTLRRGAALADLTLLDRSDPLLQSVELDIRDAGVALADAAISARRPEQAITTLATLISENPLDETLYAKHIELLAADGRSADALQRYEDLRRRLAEELGVEPSNRVQQVYLSILERDHPIWAGPLVPAQLPADVADFTGRDDHAVRVAELLTTGHDGPARPVRIAMISGMGGIGKTTLAVHVAHRLIGEFPDGQLYTDLRGVSSTVADPSQVLGSLLVALGVEGAAIPDSLDQRAGLFRSMLAGRQVLVVLDNAASEQQVRPLLPGAPGCAVLITGRTPLIGLETARMVTLDVLEQREGIALLTRIIGAERVTAEPDAAARIAGLCGQVPLAVRIAGARLAVRPQWRLSRLVAGLENEQHRLAELAAGDLAVGATLQLSYVRLGSKTRRALRLLGLLKTPDFAGWMVSALIDTPGTGPDGRQGAEAVIESLIDAQLLTIAGTDSTGELRYRFHDLVRLYARERCRLEDSADEQAAALRRYLGAYLWLSERAAASVPGPCYAAIHGPAPRLPIADRSVADRLLTDPMSWFDAEVGALSAAVGQACELGLTEFAWDIAGCLEKYFDVRSHNEDWRRMHEPVLELCRSTGDRLGEAVLLRGLLELTTWRASDNDGAAMIILYDRAKELAERFQALGEDRGTADALVMCAWGLMAQGAAEEARTTARTALRLAETSEHLGGQARAEHATGLAYGVRQLDQAALHLEKALTHARRLGNSRFEATVMQFLGAARCRLGDVVTGEDLLRRSLSIAREYSDHYVEAFSLLYLAKLYVTFENSHARPLVETVLALSRRYSLRHQMADSLRMLGELDLAEGRPAAAVSRLTESVQVWRTRGWVAFLAETLRILGLAHRELGEEGAAQQDWHEAHELFRQLGDTAAATEITELQAVQAGCGAPSDRPAHHPPVTAD